MENLTNKLRQFRDERNWQKFHTPKDLAISVSVEAAELLELFQWRDSSDLVDEELAGNARSEVADVFLYLLMFCDALGIDLEAAAEEKIEKNRRRFPVESSHGVAKPIDRSGEK
ncbi:MAG: nucleotide pyrophosphohydrolase [Roseibium sp.]